jgi:hypothetical protein
MLKFNEYLKESNEEVMEVDERHVMENMEALNSDLDTLTSRPYQNAPIFLAQLRGTLERYGIVLPASATPHFLNLSAELVYTLGETDHHMYIVYDTNDDGYVDGYAQIVSNEELKDLAGMDKNEILNSDRNLIAVRHSDWYRKRDDDAGNSDEY